MIRRISIVFLLLTVSACSQISEKPNQTNAALWRAHQAALIRVNSWNIKGRVAIKSNKESGTLTLFWEQQGPDYELRLIAPFGQGTYLFKGSDKGVSMSGPEDLLLTATTAKKLMYQSLGWNVDLDGLKYWIRGIPKPGVRHQGLSIDKQGRMSDMEQSGFNISVSRYAQLNGISLPERLLVKNEDIQLKLLIQSWEI